MLEGISLAVVLGIGATALMDLWALVLRRVLNIPLAPWHLVGRWFAGLGRGHWIHRAGIIKSPTVRNEAAIGWLMHYAVGVLFAGALLAIWGVGWAHSPRVFPALVVGVVTVAAGWFILQPGMGAGMACSSAPQPNRARALNLAAHVVFGLGLYLTALLVG
jgi:hypothetical protein